MAHQMTQEEEYEDYPEINDQTVPHDLRKLRACLICGLIKTYDQFQQNDCENCKESINVDFFADQCTTPNFEGLISLIQPENSWVAKWQRITHRVPGCYAVVVHGRPGENIISALENVGMTYFPLDNVDQ